MGKTAKVGEHMSEEFVIIDYEDRYKPELLAISLPWLEENDILEPADLEQLEHPERVLAGGGRIFLGPGGGRDRGNDDAGALPGRRGGALQIWGEGSLAQPWDRQSSDACNHRRGPGTGGTYPGPHLPPQSESGPPCI